MQPLAVEAGFVAAFPRPSAIRPSAMPADSSRYWVWTYHGWWRSLSAIADKRSARSIAGGWEASPKTPGMKRKSSGETSQLRSAAASNAVGHVAEQFQINGDGI